MSDVTIKAIIATVFIVAGTGAFLTVMATMGRPGAAGDPGKLRKLHRIFGWIYVALLVPLVFLGLDFVKEMGDGMSTRAVFHMVLAETLIALLLLKILVVRFFKGFMKNAPALGMALFSLTLIIFLVTAGFYFLQTAAGK